MTVKLRGIELFYEDTGSGSPVVLLHGNGEDHTVFDVLTRELSKNHRVIAVDSRGHGGSTKVEKGGALHYRDMAEDVAALIEELGLEKPALYGFSHGGILGLLIASEHPGLLSRLVTSGANTRPGTVKAFLRVIIRVMWFFRRSPLMRMMLDEPDITADDLRKISIPCLILAGEKDLVTENDTRFIAQNIPGAILKILPGEGHGSYIIHSEKLYPVIRGFLEGEETA